MGRPYGEIPRLADLRPGDEVRLLRPSNQSAKHHAKRVAMALNKLARSRGWRFTYRTSYIGVTVERLPDALRGSLRRY